MNTKTIGDVAELTVAAFCIAKGWQVSKPYGDNAKYDLIIDRDNHLYRIQIKARSQRKGVINLELYNNARSYRQTYDKTQLDAFIVFDIDTKRIAWLSWDDIDGISSNVTLRVKDVNNKQTANIRWFSDYEL